MLPSVTPRATDDLMALLRSGESLLMDGALGTELERRELPIEGEGWSALAVRDHGEVIRDIHRDYLEAGARLHIVNSFALARHVLEPIGIGADFEALNRRAVALFEQAVEQAGADRHGLWAAGSLSTFAANSDRSLLPSGETLLANFRDQALILREAGVDLFALEMLFDVDVSRSMLQAVADLGLPVMLGFSCSSGEPGHCDLGPGDAAADTVTFGDALGGVLDGVDSSRLIVAIMHSDFESTDSALEILRGHWQGPIAIYPNSGQFVDLHLQFDTVSGEDEFEQAALRWLRAGVQIVGGCCGIGPSHIRRLGGSLTHS